MYFIFLLFLFLLFSLILAPITIVIANKYLGLYISWIALAIAIAYVEIIKIPEEHRYGILMSLLIANIVIISLSFVYRTTKISDSIESELFFDSDTKQPNILIPLRYFTFLIYGFAASYFLTLFHSDILAGIKPAWIAYMLALFGIAVVFLISVKLPLSDFVNQKVIRRCFLWFSRGFCIVMLSLLFFSFTFIKVIVKEANNTITKYSNISPSYCIQTVNLHWQKQYKPIVTKLDLSPLTMRSKAPVGSWYGWGDPYFHSLLLIENNGSIDFYNWSYKQRKWLYLELGFEKRANIKETEVACVPHKNYLQ